MGHHRVLFVCLGNICRSPLAEALMRRHVEARKLSHTFTIDSAGTGAYHVGERPDARMRQTARAHGVHTLEQQRARQFTRADFDAFDLIVAMDRHNLADILALDRRGEHRERVVLLRAHDPDPGDGDVPDPYYGGPRGFERVYDIVERSTARLLDAIVTDDGPRA